MDELMPQYEKLTKSQVPEVASEDGQTQTFSIEMPGFGPSDVDIYYNKTMALLTVCNKNKYVPKDVVKFPIEYMNVAPVYITLKKGVLSVTFITSEILQTMLGYKITLAEE